MVPYDGRKRRIYRREWTLGELLGTWFISYEGFPFWHLVTGVMELRVEGIWGEEGRLRRQAKRWWPDTHWKYNGRESDLVCWNVDWILTEGRQVLNSEDEFWKSTKEQMIYIEGKKMSPAHKVWTGQRMWVLHKISGGLADKGHTIILLTRMEMEPKYTELKNKAAWDISGSLEVRVRGPEELGILSPVHDYICCKGKRIVVHWGFYTAVKERDPWVFVSDFFSKTRYTCCNLLLKERVHLWD